MEPTRAEQVAATLVRLPKSGADRDGDPAAGYGVRCECKFDPANQNNNERPVAENRPRSPPPEYPRAIDYISALCSKGSPRTSDVDHSVKLRLGNAH